MCSPIYLAPHERRQTRALIQSLEWAAVDEPVALNVRHFPMLPALKPAY